MAKEKILIVEDEAITALFIQDCLENLGYDVVETSTTGYEAIDAAEEYRPDLVLMDIKLAGEINGLEAARIIYDRFNIPVVYLTAYVDNNTLQKAKGTGSFGYMSKPVDEKALYRTIEIALAKHQEESSLKNANQWLSTMVKNLNDAILAIDNHGLIRFISNEAELILGKAKNELMDKSLNEIFTFKNPGKLPEDPIKILLSNPADEHLVNLISSNNQLKTIKISISPITDNTSQVIGLIITFYRYDEPGTPEELNNEMMNRKLKQLSKLIGICSFCKKIRDEGGHWAQMESYLQRQFDILFSHGVCPECTKKYYPDV
jgi:PAS domain S-box-containing protein